MKTRFSQTVVNFWWATKQVWKAAPWEAGFLFLTLGFQGCTPGVSLWVLRDFIRQYEAVSGDPGVWGWLAIPGILLLTIALTLIVETVLAPLATMIRTRLNEKMLTYCNLALMKKANSSLFLSPFDRKELHDQLQVLREEARRRPMNYCYSLIVLFKDSVAIISILIILLTVSPWLPLFIGASCLPHVLGSLWLEGKAWDFALFRSTKSRRMAWLASLPLVESSAIDIRVFGLGSHLVSRYESEASSHRREMLRQQIWPCLAASLISIMTVVGHLLTFIWAVHRIIHGGTDIAGVAVILPALIMCQRQCGHLAGDVGLLMQNLIFFEKLRSFLATSWGDRSSQVYITPKSSPSSIVVDNVSFTYPNGHVALRGISCAFRAGTTTVIVGLNGSGKSTLAKILLRLYEPTDGSILIDNNCLSSLSPDWWRRQVSFVSQEYARYHLSVRESIAWGDLSRDADDRDVALASCNGDFAAVADRLPQGLDTPLGKEFGGSTLSGGEWQRLALARALYKRAPILILDEPTSALDPLSERRLLTKLRRVDSAQAKILITHRMSATSIADHILVFQEGSLVEQGSHSDLLNLGGTFADLFNAQLPSRAEVPVL